MLKQILIFSIFLPLFAADIEPIDQEAKVDTPRALLGKRLFFEPMLSRDNTIACASCHFLPGSGADAQVVSLGIGGKKGVINSPTVLNSRYNFTQFWNGRAKSLEEQALSPIHNPVEMGESIENVVDKLKNSSYNEKFLLVYKDGVTAHNVVDAIAEFERALITPNSQFDKFLNGDKNALTQSALRGYSLYISKGCIACHNGKNIGGNMYQKLGNIIPYSSKNPSKGRYDVTKDEKDINYFKVPSLRNVALSAPYFHDGSAKTLKDAIKDMSEHQVGAVLSSDEVDDIEQFLISLTGDSPKILELENE